MPCTRSLAPLLPSRRRFLAGAGGALVLSALLPARMARAEAQGPAEGAGALAPKPGTRVAAFLEIHPDGTIKLLSPFVEGGQGIATGMAQIVGEELDVPPVPLRRGMRAARPRLRRRQRHPHDRRQLLDPVELRDHAPPRRDRPRSDDPRGSRQA